MNPELSFTVTREEAQVILNALAEQPYRVVAGLLQKLLSQASAQDGSAQDGQPELQ